jgi:hypothetical protein
MISPHLRYREPPFLKLAFVPAAFSAFRHIDPILMPWAKRHGIEVETWDRGWDIRSIWICDRDGYRRAQMWFRDPDKNGNVTVFAAALDPDGPADWGPREERRASRANLETILDEVWLLMLAWGGPGAFPSSSGRTRGNFRGPRRPFRHAFLARMLLALLMIAILALLVWHPHIWHPHGSRLPVLP